MKKCHCIIAHPVTPEERAAVVEALEYARRIGDSPAVISMRVAQLTGPCPAWADDDADDALDALDAAPGLEECFKEQGAVDRPVQL